MKIVWLKALEANQIALSSSLFKELMKPPRVTVRFGASKFNLKVVIKRTLPEKTLGLPVNLSSSHYIPKNIPYECFVKDGEIYIGPVIAYVSRGNLKKIKKKGYILALPTFLDYDSLKGLIIICAEKSFNVDSGTIEGYYYNPKGKNPKQIWKYGKFPLPNAIFNRSLLEQEIISSLQKKIGNTVFNSYWNNLDKWNTWQVLSRDELIKKYLPYTEQFLGTEQMEKVLGEYSSIYLKPANKSQGRGMMKVSKAGGGISLVDDERQKYYFRDYHGLDRFLKNRINIPYIIQQAVNFTANNRHVDFRLVLQRDGSKEWSCSGLVARIAQAGSIITNTRGRETSMLGRVVLKNFYKVNEETAEKIEREMTQLVVKAAKMYEEQGYHLGDLAADIALDANLHVWLLELQLNYGVNSHSVGIPQHFFNKIIATPFRYAKALAGFKVEG